MAVDLDNEVQRWAAGWSHTLNRAEGKSVSGCVDRRGLDTEYQTNPERLAVYLTQGVPVLPLVAESWATRAVRAAGIALVYLPNQKAILGWEVHSGVWAIKGCQHFPDPPRAPETVDDVLEWLADEDGGQAAFSVAEHYAPYSTEVNATRIRMAAECFADEMEDPPVPLPDGWPNVDYATAMEAWREACADEDRENENEK